MARHQGYESRRLVTALEAQGIQVGRYRVRHLMRQAGLKPVWKRKFIHTTDSKHNLPIAANILDRQFNPVAPNIAWVGDITTIRTGSGWLYWAIVLELFSRKVVGWAMSVIDGSGNFSRVESWLSPDDSCGIKTRPLYFHESSRHAVQVMGN